MNGRLVNLALVTTLISVVVILLTPHQGQRS